MFIINVCVFWNVVLAVDPYKYTSEAYMQCNISSIPHIYDKNLMFQVQFE